MEQELLSYAFSQMLKEGKTIPPEIISSLSPALLQLLNSFIPKVSTRNGTSAFINLNNYNSNKTMLVREQSKVVTEKGNVISRETTEGSNEQSNKNSLVKSARPLKFGNSEEFVQNIMPVFQYTMVKMEDVSTCSREYVLRWKLIENFLCCLNHLHSTLKQTLIIFPFYWYKLEVLVFYFSIKFREI